MSFLDDDEELFVPSSHADALVSKNRAKQALRALQKTILQEQVSGKADEETKRIQKQSKDSSTFGTKTLYEKKEEDLLQADTKHTPESAITQNQKEAESRTQEEQEISNEDL